MNLGYLIDLLIEIEKEFGDDIPVQVQGANQEELLHADYAFYTSAVNVVIIECKETSND